jgi:hypothetical protein
MSNEKDTYREKTALIVGPIGSNAHKDRQRLYLLVSKAIQPVLDEFDIRAIPFYLVSELGSANVEVVNHLLNDRIVICDITGLNPNVMYEFAVRKSSKRPAILIGEIGSYHPSYTLGEKTIDFELSQAGFTSLKSKLKDAIIEILKIPVLEKLKPSDLFEISENGKVLRKLPDWIGPPV